jgi:O-antigen/teichoic acid export membrane protein
VFPKIKPFGKIDNNTKKIIRNKVTFLGLHSLSATLISSIDNIVISAFMGLAVIGIYGNYTYISSAVLGFVMVVYSSIRPSIGNFLVTNTQEENIKLHKAVSFSSFWIGTFCTACLVSLYQPFMNLWVGEANMLSFVVVILVSSFFYFNVRTQFYTMCYIHTAGLWNKTLVPKIVASIINLIIDLVTVKYIGVVGIVLGSLLTYALILYPLDMIVVYKYVLKDDIKKALLKMTFETLLAAIIVFATYLLCSLITDSGFLGLFKRLSICISIPNIFLLLISHKTGTLQFFTSHFRKVIDRNK